MPPLFWDLPLGVSFHFAHLVSRSNFKPGALFAIDLMSGVFCFELACYVYSDTFKQTRDASIIKRGIMKIASRCFFF